MSDEQKTQAQQDAELIADFRKYIREHNGTFWIDMSDFDLEDELLDDTTSAMFRTIDALTAERERLKAKESALRDELARAYRDLADMHEGEGYHNDAKRYRARAEAMEAPPRNESDGAE